MRIAFIVTSFPTPSYTFVLNQIAGLIRRGHEVDIYADRPGDLGHVHADVERFDILERVHAAAMPRNPALRLAKGLWVAAANCWRAPRLHASCLNVVQHGELAASLVLLYAVQPLLHARGDYDIIHCHFGPNGLKGLFFREHGLLRGKLVTSFHGYDVNTYPRRRGKSVYADLFAKGDAFTANSRFTMRRCTELGCPEDKLLLLPMGVDTARFPPRGRQERSGRRVLTVGRLVEVKGVEYALRAFAAIAPRYPDVSFHIVGDGPLRAGLARLARESGVADRVRFLGARTFEEVLTEYAHADVFVLAAVRGGDGAEEAQGVVLLEAQAAGLPVVATRVGGIPESVSEDESAFLVPERDPAALAEQISALLDDPARCAEMGRAGRRFVEEKFEQAKLDDRLVRVYEEVLHEAPVLS